MILCEHVPFRISRLGLVAIALAAVAILPGWSPGQEPGSREKVPLVYKAERHGSVFWPVDAAGGTARGLGIGAPVGGRHGSYGYGPDHLGGDLTVGSFSLDGGLSDFRCSNITAYGTVNLSWTNEVDYDWVIVKRILDTVPPTEETIGTASRAKGEATYTDENPRGYWGQATYRVIASKNGSRHIRSSRVATGAPYHINAAGHDYRSPEVPGVHPEILWRGDGPFGSSVKLTNGDWRIGGPHIPPSLGGVGREYQRLRDPDLWDVRRNAPGSDGLPDDIVLYWVEAYTRSRMSYIFPVKNGVYTVRLHMMDIYAGRTGAGMRCFDLTIEEVQVLDDFDLQGSLGARGRYDDSHHRELHIKEYVVTVDDGLITLTWDIGEGRAVDMNPIIQAIEVLPGGDAAKSLAKPKARGRAEGVAPPPRGVRISLLWEGPPEMRCIAKGDLVEDFCLDVETIRYDGREVRVERPVWDEVKEYIKKRKKNYSSPEGQPMPVIIDFDPGVPLSFVTKLTDICAELGIKDVSFSQREAERRPRGDP